VTNSRERERQERQGIADVLVGYGSEIDGGSGVVQVLCSSELAFRFGSAALVGERHETATIPSTVVPVPQMLG
jgi:hypothetical protein